MRIIICDDNPNELDQTKKFINDFFSKANISNEIITFNNPNTFLNLFLNINNDFDVDIFFLDIIMEINGINVAKSIKNKCPNAIIIFTSTSKDFAVDAFDIKAFNYLIKPLDLTKLHSVLNDIILLFENKLNNKITIKTSNHEIVNFEINKIKYIESINRRMIFYLNDGREITSLSLRDKFLESIPIDYEKYNFLNCHSSFIVNMNYINEIQSYCFILKDHTEIPISIRNYKKCKETYINYLIGD